jgi:hypothetical protein
MRVESMTLDQIRRAGLEALENSLGPEGMIRFLQLFETGSGDYTKERSRWLRRTNVEVLAEEIVTGRAKD